MSDPAIEAAQALKPVRELHSKSPMYNHAADCEICDSEDDAISDQHETFEGTDGDWLCGSVVVGYCCHHCTEIGGCSCYEPVEWPCDTAKLIYAAEEI